MLKIKSDFYNKKGFDMSKSSGYGSALGPDWSLDLTMKGLNKEVNFSKSKKRKFNFL